MKQAGMSIALSVGIFEGILSRSTIVRYVDFLPPRGSAVAGAVD